MSQTSKALAPGHFSSSHKIKRLEPLCIDWRCMDFQALWLTLRLAAATTAILLAIALPLAWWIAAGRGISHVVVQALVALPLVLPPTVLGFYLLVVLGPLTAPGRL